MEVPVLLLTIVPVLLNGLDQLVQLVRILPSTLLFHFVHFQSKNVHCFPFQMSMSVEPVLTTVNNCVPTFQEAITVVVTLDMSCRLMDTSVKVFVTMHSVPTYSLTCALFVTVHMLMSTRTHARTHACTSSYYRHHLVLL